MTTKKCKNCKKILDIELFVKKKENKDGRSKECKKCYNNRTREYRKKYYSEAKKQNPEAYKEMVSKAKKKYRKSERGKLKELEYATNHRQETKIRSKKWYKKNKKRKYEKQKEWIKNNPEKYKALIKRQNIKRRQNPISNFANRIRFSIRKSFTKLFFLKRERIFNYLGYSNIDLCNHLSPSLNNPCSLCNKVILTLSNSNIDHIIPMCSASSEEDVIRLNQLSNLRLICQSCNLNKISEDLLMRNKNE